MKIIDGIGEPIRHEDYKGPAIDALNGRKEDNDRARVTIEELRDRYHSVRKTLLGSLKTLVAAGDRRAR